MRGHTCISGSNMNSLDLEDTVFVKNKILSISEVANILRNPPERIISAPPVKPKAGQAFFFKALDMSKQGSF